MGALEEIQHIIRLRVSERSWNGQIELKNMVISPLRPCSCKQGDQVWIQIDFETGNVRFWYSGSWYSEMNVLEGGKPLAIFVSMIAHNVVHSVRLLEDEE